MSPKKTMFMIWLVASILWACFSSYMFRVDQIKYAYERHTHFGIKVAKGQRADPLRWGYYNRSYKRAQRLVKEANQDLTMFLLIGLGLPGIMLAIGTALLENAYNQNQKPPSGSSKKP